MLHKLLPILLLGALVVGSVGCKKKPVKLKPGELSQAQKETLKTNAISAYGRIVKEYKDSPHAAEAEARIKALKATQKK